MRASPSPSLSSTTSNSQRGFGPAFTTYQASPPSRLLKNGLGRDSVFFLFLLAEAEVHLVEGCAYGDMGHKRMFSKTQNAILPRA
jgi:hypothetical protein